MADGHRALRSVVDNVAHVLIGKRHELELALVALGSEGHILIEDVPGVGKTMLAKALAKSIGCSFRRIQFTPDLLKVPTRRPDQVAEQEVVGVPVGVQVVLEEIL